MACRKTTYIAPIPVQARAARRLLYWATLAHGLPIVACGELPRWEGSIQVTEETRANIVKELGRIEEDSEYSAKGHYNAADPWGCANLSLGLVNAVVAGIAGASAFKGHENVAGALAILASALAAAITFLAPGDRASIHKRSGGEYHTLRNRCRIFRDVTLASLANDDEVLARFDELTARRDELNATCPQIPGWAFRKARKGIEEGETQYRVDRKD